MINQITQKVRQNGIGLLELMLSLTIITILLIAATRYYQATQTSHRIQTAINSIQAVYSATQQYYTDYGTKPTIDNLKENALLPDNFTDFANPWGGGIDDTTGQSCTGFSLTFLANVPKNACTNIKTKIANTYSAGDVVVTSCPNTEIGNMSVCFPLQ